MSWKNRLNETITLTSPSGRKFEARWLGNERVMEKKLGIFEFAKARGVLVQDLDVGGVKYPLDIFFDGENHDLDARRFFEACKERGAWKVMHPVYGILNLQLIRITEDSQPVSSANMTKLVLDTVEVGIDLPEVTVSQLESAVVQQAANAQDASKTQFVYMVKVNKPSLLAVLKESVGAALAVVARVKSTIAGVMAQISAIRQAVLGVINAVVVSVVSLAGVLQNIITLPGLIINDIQSRFAYFGQIIDDSLHSLDPHTVSAAHVNAVAVMEVVTTSAVVGMALSVVDADITTRDEALSYLEQIDAAFIKVTNGLDAIQSRYAGAAVDQQYFSQSASFNDMLELLSNVRALLLLRSFNLAAAKYVTLTRERTPIDVALSEGVDLDTFIASNRLQGEEILLMPVGKQVVVYL